MDEPPPDATVDAPNAPIGSGGTGEGEGERSVVSSSCRFAVDASPTASARRLAIRTRSDVRVPA
eukprot:3371106-Rhodomonas_salina.2